MTAREVEAADVFIYTFFLSGRVGSTMAKCGNNNLRPRDLFICTMYQRKKPTSRTCMILIPADDDTNY